MIPAQRFKPIYFPDYDAGFNLAFGRTHAKLFSRVEYLDSSELRLMLGADSYAELKLRAMEEGLQVNTYCLWYLQKNLISRNRASARMISKERPIARFEGRVLEGDCLDVMRDIPAKSVDMVLCDLPYGTTQNKWDSVIPLDTLWGHYERIVKESGVIVLTGQGLFTASLMLSNPDLFKYKITWVKSKPTNFLNARKQPLRKHEDVCVFYKSQPAYNPQMTSGLPYNKGFRKDQLTGSYGDFKTVEVKSSGERYPTDVVYFKTAEAEGQVHHPTQKPVELGRYLIRTYSRPGDIILDNACGSGSFLVAAVLEGRRFIGIEKNEEVYLHKKKRTDYIRVCASRIKQARLEYESLKKRL